MRYLIFFMSYLIVAVIAVFFGVQINQTEPAQRIVRIDNTPRPLPALPTETTNSLRFDDIEQQATVFQQRLAAHQLAAVSDTATLKAYLGKLLVRDDPFLNYNIAFVFLERFIELDVAAAIDYVENADLPPTQTNQLLASILTSWVRHDPEAAIDYFRRISNMQLKMMIGARLLQDPILERTGLLEDVSGALGPYGEQILSSMQMQQRAPEVLFDEALMLTGARRQQQLMAAMSLWMRSDPDAALSRLGDLPNPQERKNMLRMIISVQGRQDPLAALETLRNYAPDDLELESQALTMLVHQNPEIGMPYVEAFVKRTGNVNILANVVSTLAQNDIQSAIDYAEAVDQKHRQTVMQRLAHTYIRTNPEEGMHWVMSLDDKSIQRAAISALPQSDMDLAELWLDRINDAELETSLLQNIANTKANTSPEHAHDWLQEHQDKDGYSNAMTNILYQWTSQDPERAAELLVQHQEDPSYQNVFRNTAENWAKMGYVRCRGLDAINAGRR